MDHTLKSAPSLIFSANGVNYRLSDGPVVVICIDGGDAAYLESGWARGLLPTLRRFATEGFYGLAAGTVPSFTCPNNMSIITGVLPDVHGISGNFYLDPDSFEPRPMTGPELLRAQTILAACAEAGGRIACVTAKDKLRLQLQKGLDIGSGRHVSLSAEKASDCTLRDNGVGNILDQIGEKQADMYSPELSLQVLQIGRALLEQGRFDLVYLSLSDYVQHQHAPGTDAADDFYARLDHLVGDIDASGACVALCADHGMNDKADSKGQPRIVFVHDVLAAEFDPATFQVVCPITDAFVRHHGALGGMVRVWLKSGHAPVRQMIDCLKKQRGVDLVLTKAQACEMFSLPLDREADIVVFSRADHALGASREDHDLTQLAGIRLRTHGGMSEALIPILINRQVSRTREAEMVLRGLGSHQVFDIAINHTHN